MKKSTTNNKSEETNGYTSPSLLDPESTGGFHAKEGFSFQDGALLAKIPKWLANEGFEAIIQESIGDFEVRFFSPSEGHTIEAFEAKKHRVTLGLFWKEIDRFKTISKSKSYTRFVIVCGELSQDVHAIVNAMDQIRGGLTFYDPKSQIIINSINNFKNLLKEKGNKKSYAEFLLRYVFVEHDWTSHEAAAKGIFRENAALSPLFSDLSAKTTGEIFGRLLELVSGKLNKSVTRSEIEQRISSEPMLDDGLNRQSIKMEALISNDVMDEDALLLKWPRFFGAGTRSYPDASEWQNQLMRQLDETYQWINAHRSQKRILFTGRCRLSSAIAFGHTFAAVTGFSIDVSHRQAVWSSDSYPTSLDNYDIEVEYDGEIGSELVVIVQNVRQIGNPIIVESETLTMKGLPSIRISGGEPLRSDSEANLFVSIAKEHVQKRLEGLNASKIHLFTLCPLPLAMFLGHRLNGLASVQCYEWTGGTSYVPTVLLNT